MFKREYVAHHGKNRIIAMNSWFGGAKLYINGDCVDTDKTWITTSSTALLRGSVPNEDGSRSVVEVFGWTGLVSVKLKICVDGQWVGGDKF